MRAYSRKEESLMGRTAGSAWRYRAIPLAHLSSYYRHLHLVIALCFPSHETLRSPSTTPASVPKPLKKAAQRRNELRVGGAFRSAVTIGPTSTRALRMSYISVIERGAEEAERPLWALRAERPLHRSIQGIYQGCARDSTTGVF